jgi:SAM-dependent methyltransferase
MKSDLLNWLICPFCKGALKVAIMEEDLEHKEIKDGDLLCDCGRSFSIKNYIPRFVESDYYAESFSFEWKIHKKTQLDSFNQNRLSEDAFRRRTDFSLEELKGKLVLDAGCGMGRYTEVAQKYGAIVIGFDLSRAVDVAFENIGLNKNIHLVQADIFNLPFKDSVFDFIYSFGVLHHTGDAERAFKQLPQLLKIGGKISIFVYSSYNKGIVYTSNFWRFFTKRIPKRILYYFCFISVPLYYIYKIPVLGSIGKMFFVISMQPDWRWRVLDTFDWYSPKYQSKHTHSEVFRWFEEEGLTNIKIFNGEITMLGSKQNELL